MAIGYRTSGRRSRTASRSARWAYKLFAGQRDGVIKVAITP